MKKNGKEIMSKLKENYSVNPNCMQYLKFGFNEECYSWISKKYSNKFSQISGDPETG